MNRKVLGQIILICFTFISPVFNRDIGFHWDFPTVLCDSLRDASRLYSNIVNSYNYFITEHLAVFYDSENLSVIPHELSQHLLNLEDEINNVVPDRDYSGYVIIDFDPLHPVYTEDYSNLTKYQTLSEYIDIHTNSSWKVVKINNFKKNSSKDNVLKVLLLAKKLRPNVKWGYNSEPYCFLKIGEYEDIQTCQDDSNVLFNLSRINDSRIYEKNEIPMPVVYLPKEISLDNILVKKDIESKAKDVLQRIKYTEKGSIGSSNEPKLLTYHRYIFLDTFLNANDTAEITLNRLKYIAQGIISSGNTYDFSSSNKCGKFYNYLVKEHWDNNSYDD